MANVNNGHRQRLRERMLSEGLDGFKDHEILELLLFQSIPRKDTNKLAHTLLERFGNLTNVLNAQPEQLMMVKGISQATACNLAMLKEVWRRYKRDEKDKISLENVANILQYARRLVAESYRERLVVVYVDRGTKFLYSEEYVSDDDSHSIRADIKKIVSCAVRLQASGIMLFHCHVQGNCKPSVDDFKFTEKLIFALGGLEIVLLEHIIFNAEGKYYSFYSEGDIDRIVQEYNVKLQQQTRLN